MTDEEILEHLKKKYPQFKNRPKRVKVSYPKEMPKENNFNEILEDMMVNFIKKEIRK